MRNIFLLLVAAISVFAQSGPAGHVAITTGPYLQNPSANGMTVMWITNRNTTGVVEYGVPGGELKTVYSSHDGLIDTYERVHKVMLTDLQPGTLYRYRVVSRDILTFAPYKVDFGETVSSGFHEFRTFDPHTQDFSFLVFNDLHDIPATLSDLLKVAGGRPYDFVVWNGDSISYVEDEKQITTMLDEAVHDFASRLPLVWVRGNHETRGRFARQLPQYLDSPGGRYFYSFDYGPAHFIVLDAGEDKFDSHAEYSGQVDFFHYRREEAEWLKKEVKTEAFRRAKYRVVLAHMPFPTGGKNLPLSNQISPFTGMADAYETFGGILEAAGIDMMIAGHVHIPAITDPEPGRHSYPIIRGGGPKDQARTIIRVDVNNRAIEATILRPDGTTFGTRRVAAK